MVSEELQINCLFLISVTESNLLNGYKSSKCEISDFSRLHTRTPFVSYLHKWFKSNRRNLVAETTSGKPLHLILMTFLEDSQALGKFFWKTGFKGYENKMSPLLLKKVYHRGALIWVSFIRKVLSRFDMNKFLV